MEKDILIQLLLERVKYLEDTRNIIQKKEDKQNDLHFRKTYNSYCNYSDLIIDF